MTKRQLKPYDPSQPYHIEEIYGGELLCYKQKGYTVAIENAPNTNWNPRDFSVVNFVIDDAESGVIYSRDCRDFDVCVNMLREFLPPCLFNKIKADRERLGNCSNSRR